MAREHCLTRNRSHYSLLKHESPPPLGSQSFSHFFSPLSTRPILRFQMRPWQQRWPFLKFLSSLHIDASVLLPAAFFLQRNAELSERCKAILVWIYARIQGFKVLYCFWPLHCLVAASKLAFRSFRFRSRVHNTSSPPSPVRNLCFMSLVSFHHITSGA